MVVLDGPGRDTSAIESPSFLTEGGAVRVFPENNRIRFNVGERGAERKDLKTGNQRLTLAAR